MHVRGLIQVPRCSLTMGNLSMWLGTCDVPKCPDVKQSIQLCTLLPCQLDLVEALRNWDHVLQSLCRRREGRHGKCHVFSKWWVSGDGK